MTRVGELLGGRYRIERKLGEGGMGAVYAATQEPLGRKVAVKVLLPVLAQDATLVARFRREAELAASLGHPNIVQVTDFGLDDAGAAFLVMDLLEGESLGDLLEREVRLAPERVRFIATQVLSALDAAHARGVVHRDLKPDNVYLTSVSGVSDLVKLLDFGIARLGEGDGRQKMTATGQVLGTPAYMSPEQARGREVDARSDLYALGVLMYEALTGRMPVTGSNYHELMFNIVGETPTPLLELAPDVEPALVAVVERAMAKDPNARYPDARAMHDALATIGPLRASPAMKLPSHPPTRAASESGTSEASDAAFAATMATPQALGAVSAATPAATPALPSAPPPTLSSSPRGPSPWIWGALALALLAAGVAAFVASRGPDHEEAVAVAPTTAAEPALAPAELALPDLEAAVMARVEEALAAERARQASDAPSDSAPSEAPSLAPDEADATRTGAPDAVVEEQRRASAMTTSMSDEGASAMSSMAADGAATMARTSAMSPEAATRVIHCGSRPQEVPIVRPGDTVRVTFRQTNNVVPMATFSAATASWTPRLTSCYVGHPFVGGMFTLELDASGRVTKLRRNPFCGAPAALERCLEQALEGTAIGNDTGAPAEMRFDVSHQGSG